VIILVAKLLMGFWFGVKTKGAATRTPNWHSHWGSCVLVEIYINKL
jgi:hypothetical protein